MYITMRHPVPTPCFTCGAYHWSDQCTLKQQQQQQHNATWPSSNANNPATSTSLNSCSSFPSWACPSPNTNSSNYKPPANLVNSIANKDGYCFNSPKPSVHTLLHSTPTCSSTHSPVHAIPQLQLQQTHLNKTPAFATVKFNSNHPFASTHHAIINTGASLSVIRQEYAQKHLSHLLCHPFKNFQLNGIGQSSSTGYHLIDIHFLTKEGYNTIILTALFIINNISVNLILGLDFLLPHHAKIDLQDGILSFPCHPGTILLSCQSGPLIPPHLPPLPSPIPCPFVPSIHVKEAFTILPVHQAHIETTIDVLPHTPQYLVSPTSTGKYLHVACCVGSSTASKHFVLVLNTGDRPIPVSGGHLLGYPLPLHTACPTPAVHTINTVAIPETDSDAEPFPITDLKINPDLTPEQSEALHQVLMEQCHIFGFGSQQLGSTNLATMNVDTGNHPPISTPPYRISPQGHATIDEKLTELLNQGIIEEADSPWASPAILV
ncbi:hypothetical protein I310_00563 [Cryptococcus deuterogattii CA1014]|nr:hypothetical protein I310_00563 [Cryptococcus deuterogattii CA1014]